MQVNKKEWIKPKICEQILLQEKKRVNGKEKQKNHFDVQAALVVCGLFICDFAYI